jgi:hypothetical protein
VSINSEIQDRFPPLTGDDEATVELTTYQDGPYIEWHQEPTKREMEQYRDFVAYQSDLCDQQNEIRSRIEELQQEIERLDTKFVLAGWWLEKDFINRRGPEGWDWIRNRYDLRWEAEVESGPGVAYENQNRYGPQG